MATDHDKRIIVYPSYINSKCTVAEGRRIPLAAACERPSVFEMMDCCKALKIPAEVEGKHYPRDWERMGRLRVQLFDESGAPLNPEVANRRALLLKMGEMVPKHIGRSKKAAAKSEAAGAGAGSSSGGAAASSSKQSGKKGKKKK